MSTFVFAGPTLASDEVASHLPRATLLPPIQHGDLLALEPKATDIIVIIDGLFHQTAPVRHKEILHCLDAGTTVIGCSSMGALRAAELSAFGMIGFGSVYEMYATQEIDGDDEVAVAHADADHGFRQTTTPLVDVRISTQAALGAGVLTQRQAIDVVEAARSLHYLDRTPHRLRSMLSGPRFENFWAWVAQPSNQQLGKRADALACLRAVRRGELQSDGRSADWGSWRTTYLQHWLRRYQALTTSDGRRVPRLAAMQFRQLFDASFAAAWRRFVLRWIADIGDSRGFIDMDVELAAVHRANERGLAWESLDAEQKRFWLTEMELTNLPSHECMTRLLVRSCRSSPAAPDWPLSKILWNEAIDDDLALRVADALEISRAASASDPGRSVHHLRADRLRARLVGLWDIIDRPDELDAAARDRGFDSADGAAEVLRYFYLWSLRRDEPADG
ncbi:MAG TPA: TfuA-like protein [Mycobacteriales bacterium]|nr:TfuA-like protein [Mycobacteriales bacterium]